MICGRLSRCLCASEHSWCSWWKECSSKRPHCCRRPNNQQDNPNLLTTSQVKINKEYLISGSRDKTIKIWDIFASSCITTLIGHDNWIRNLLVHPSGNYIVSASDDKSIRIWDLKTGRCCKKIVDAHDRFVVSLAINSKYPLMASGSNDQSIKIWDCK